MQAPLAGVLVELQARLRQDALQFFGRAEIVEAQFGAIRFELLHGHVLDRRHRAQPLADLRVIRDFLPSPVLKAFMEAPVALVFLALQSANLLSFNFQKGYRISARFDNIGGLKPQAAVRSAGVVVGRVESITFDDKTFQARVTLSMDDRYAFPKDSSLKKWELIKIQR